MSRQKKILILCSNAVEIPLREGGSHPTGNFLGELTDPLETILRSNNFELSFFTPQGKPISIDANSNNLMYWGFSKKNLEHGKALFNELLELGLNDPGVLEDLAGDQDKLNEFDCLFVPGGHGPMVDLLYENSNVSDALNKSTAMVLAHFHTNVKTTALICHAPAILACARQSSGSWIYRDYRMTCVSQFSEWLTEDFGLMKVIHGHIKEYPTHLLKNLGAVIEQNFIPMIPKVVQDRELLTGQDPYSGKLLGKILYQTLISK